MPVAQFVIGPEGITLPTNHHEPFDVYFDDQHVWSFAPSERRVKSSGATLAVPWPRAMHFWLDGVATVSLRQADREMYAEQVRFGSSEERVEFVDEAGIPVMIDKWGLIQRPFSGRGEAVVTEMMDVTEQIIDILRDELGIECWLAFGSLLGAAREGRVIAHDSDVDLAYLSEHHDPAAVNQEMYAITRALRTHGLRVVNKTGAFVTVIFTAADEATGSVDVYSTFHLGELLYETATVRAPVPRSAILPLGRLSFEGRMLPVPADVDAMLQVSYGPSWRTPDPSFRHEPGREIIDRFDAWFGSLMRGRRDWERWLRHLSPAAINSPSEFQAWAQERIDPGYGIYEVGAGFGSDAVAFGRAGHPTVGIDYIRGGFIRAGRVVRAEELPVQLFPVNLLSLRDAMAATSVAAHALPMPRALFAREVWDCLDRQGRTNFAQAVRMFGRTGDRVFMEFGVGRTKPIPAGEVPVNGGVRYLVRLREAVAMLADAGVVVEEIGTAGVTDDGRLRYRIAGRYLGHDR